MTIEYTYPEPPKPTGATVRRSPKTRELSFELDQFGEVIWLNHNLFSGAFDPADVPLVCKAMMTLAGHEWPLSNSNKAALAMAAERIIARLEKYRASHHPIQDDFTDGLVAAYRTAEQLVREEYGL